METNQLKELYKVMTDNGFDEIELKLGEQDKIKMVRDKSMKNKTNNSAKTVASKTSKVDNSKKSEKSVSPKTEISSEFVGVFQFLDSDENYWPKIGDSVAMGEKLGKISTLNSDKLVKSPVDGRISEIAVKNDSLVDYGRLLFVIEDSDGNKA